MRLNEIAIWCSIIISIISIAFSIYFEANGITFGSAIFTGIFSSGVLTLMISIINYFIARKKTLEDFYTYMMKAIRNFNQFENEGNIDRTIDIVLQMNQFDYTPIGNAYGDIKFFLNDNSKRKYIYNNIYKPTLDLRHTIAEKSYHFKEYKKAECGNLPVMKDFIDDLDNAIMERYKNVETNGENQVMTTVYNKIVKQLNYELQTRYFNIMYPKIMLKRLIYSKVLKLQRVLTGIKKFAIR